MMKSVVVSNASLNIEFENALSDSSGLSMLSLERDNQGNYLDKNTQYAWQEYLRINHINFFNYRKKS